MAYTSSVLYARTSSSTFDMPYYLSTHMPLVHKLWGPFGLESYEVLEFKDDIAGSESPYSVQAILRWKDAESARKAVKDQVAQQVFGDVKNFSSEKPGWMWGESVGRS